MKEKQEWCKRCHGGILHPTLIPNELKCNYCGGSCIGMDLVDNIQMRTNGFYVL